MNFSDSDKQLLKSNSAIVRCKVSVVGTSIVYTEDDYITEWTIEDFRYVPDNGFIGQFVERLFDGTLLNLPLGHDLNNRELNLQIGISDGSSNEPSWYNYGNFIITKVDDTDTTGIIKFESADYTKRFNKSYEDRIKYPCTSLELLNDICKQADVELDSNENCYIHAVSEKGLTSGYYYVLGNEINEYLVFNLPNGATKYDSFMLKNDDKLIFTHIDVNDNYKVIKSEIEYEVYHEIPFTIDGQMCLYLETRRNKYYDFINNDFVIQGNCFDGDVTCRDVVKAISKLGYTWVRVNENNKVCLDFKPKQISDIDEFNILTTDEYYDSTTTNSECGPINRVILGLSAFNGEGVSKESEDYSPELEKSIKILDNELTYKVELRQIALNGAEVLFGMFYKSIDINTIGHPWLKGDDLIELHNVNDEVIYTYPFNRKIDYKGYIDENISFDAKSNVDTEYEYTGQISNIGNKTTATVDKMKGEISLLSEHVDTVTKSIKVTDKKEGNPIEIQEAGEYPLVDLTIYGKTIDGESIAGTLNEEDGNYYLNILSEDTTGNLKSIEEINMTYSEDVPISENITSNFTIIDKENSEYVIVTEDYSIKLNYLWKREYDESGRPSGWFNNQIDVKNGYRVYVNKGSESPVGDFVVGDSFSVVDDENICTKYTVKSITHEDRKDIFEWEILENQPVPKPDTTVKKTNIELCSLYGTFDEYNNGTVIKRIGLDEDGLYILDEPITYKLEVTHNNLYKGYNRITDDSGLLPKLELTYQYDSDINATYATRNEILVTKESIEEISQRTDSFTEDMRDGYSDLLDKYNGVDGKIDTITTDVKEVKTNTYSKTQVQQIATGVGYFLTEDKEYKQGTAYYVDDPNTGQKIQLTNYVIGDPITGTVYEHGTVTAVISTEAQFDKDGMRYTKTDAPTSSLINYRGLEVDDRNNNELLFAGYDDTPGSSTYGHSIVRTENLTVGTYCIVGKHGRFEVYTDTTGREGVGFFLI